jgi:hypothetical protein
LQSSGAQGREASAYRWNEDVADPFILSAGWLARPDLLRTARTIRSCAVDTQDAVEFLSLHIPRAENFVCDALEPLSAASLLRRIDAIERRVQDLVGERQRSYREQIEKQETRQLVLFEQLRQITADKHDTGTDDKEKGFAANHELGEVREELLRNREKIRILLEAMLDDVSVSKIYQKGAEQQQNVIDRARRADFALQNATKKMCVFELGTPLQKAEN